MAKYVIDGATLSSIADSIRVKKGTTANIAPENMPTEIASIETGGGGENLDDVIAEQAELIEQLSATLDEKAQGGAPTPTQEKTVDIKENGTVQVVPDEGYALSKVTANVNVPSDKKPEQEKSIEITKNGTTEVVPDDGSVLTKVGVTVNVPEPIPVLQEKSVTPTKSAQTVTADNGFDGLSNVNVSAIPDEYIVPSGTLNVEENGTHDVTDKASVSVNVPIPEGYIQPSGTLNIAENGEYDVTEKASVLVDIPERLPILQEKTVTENGEVTPDSGYDGLSKVNVNVEASGGGGSDLAKTLFDQKIFVEHNLTEIPADGFRGWQFVEKIDMPNVTKIGQYACYNCVDLKEIDFPLCENIGNYAFYNNTDVTRVNMPNLKTTGTNALRQLTSLVSVTLPSLTAINGTVFQKCTLLEKADFNVVKSVGANAFNGCSVLTALILRNSTMAMLANVSAFTSTPIASGTGFIYVRKSLVSQYASATNWSTFASQFRAIEDYPEITGGA